MTLALHDFDDADGAATALSAAIAADMRAALATRQRALLLVSGGRSPIILFTALAGQELAWDRIDISLVDERCVPPDSDAANALLVRRHLMAGPVRAARWIALVESGLIAQAADPLAAGEQAAALACRNPLLAEAAVVVLGLGNDGHTASLFADAAQWDHARTTPDRFVALQPAQAPHARVSLSLQALRAQRRCYMWATGAEKSATLARLQKAAAAAENGDRLAQQGPVACLIADDGVLLEAYCSRRE